MYFFLCYAPGINYVGHEHDCIGTQTSSCEGPLLVCYVDFGNRIANKFNLFKVNVFDFLEYTSNTKTYNQTCKIKSYDVGTDIYELFLKNYWYASCAGLKLNIVCFSC